MTVITNKFTLSLLLMVLFGVFFYVSYDYVTGGPGEEVDVAIEEESETAAVEGELPQDADREFYPVENAEYFVEYRLERDRVRSRQIELLQQIVENPNSVAETRQEAQQKLLEITENLEMELQLENMIVAKGYKDAVLFIQPNQVVAVINKENLTEKDVTIIADMIANSTGHDLENIVIIPRS